MHRLHPDPDAAHRVDPMELIPTALGELRRTGRPYVVANFIASADGRTAVDGDSTGLGDDGDRRIFRSLRGCADAVLAGTGTIGAEHYGALARDPEVSALRARLGLAPQPPLVTITRSGRVPAIPLLEDPGSTLILYTGAEPSGLDAARATVHVERRDPGELTPEAVLLHLGAAHGIRLLLCEGGSSLFGALLGAGLCDELFLTLAPLLVGGAGPPLTPRGVELRRRLRLAWALGEGDYLYLRYALGD